jgi:hypothetical protein
MKIISNTLKVTTMVWMLFLMALPLHSQNIPTPEQTLGFKVGADFKLATYEQSIEYFKKLDASSDLIQLRMIGKTSEGRPWYAAFISSKENLDNLEHYRSISQQLAHPANLSRAEAKRLSKEGKPIVHIDGGLHASEVAGAQHTILLAYDLISHSNDEETKRILDDVILILWPSLNPDGQDIIANWYKENVGTSYEVTPVPWLYQKYVGHDNNRDSYMANMVESRVIARAWRKWEPNIIHVHHQTSPFPTRIWLPPFAEPVANRTPPIVAREVNMIGMAMAQRLETEGLEGAVHMGKGFDAWYPGYIDYMPVLQNIPSFWTETALYRYATPHFYTVRDFPKDKKDFRIESLYSSPWKGGWWRIKDAIDYMETSSMAVLDYASKYSEVLLFNKYQAAKNTIEKYKKEPPYAYFIPQKQRDPVRPVELLKRLAFNGVKISQLNKQITFENETYPKGTWVIPMDQEFGELARQVLEVQDYPDLREFPGGPPEQPYDAAGWTLPIQFEVNVVAAASPLTQNIRTSLEEVKGEAVNWEDGSDKVGSKIDFVSGIGFETNAVAAGIKPLPGSLSGSGSVALLDPKENNSFRVLAEAFKKGYRVSYINQKYGISGASNSQLRQWIKDYAVNIRLTSKASKTTVKPRIGLYRPWTASMDEGWTRWLLDNFEIEYIGLRNSDFIVGNLKDKFDVILISSEREQSIINGYATGQAPPRYVGGISEQGVRNLDEFINKGGTLVCLNQSSEFAINALHLPVKNAVKNLKRQDFFTGGSIMGVTVNTDHPVMAGMPEKANVFVERSPVFETTEGFEGEALAKYQLHGSALRSGYLLGSEHLNGYAAALDVHHGNGHVILFGFRPQWRGQPMGTYRALFNALLYGGNISKNHEVTTGFWESPNETKVESKKE